MAGVLPPSHRFLANRVQNIVGPHKTMSDSFVRSILGFAALWFAVSAYAASTGEDLFSGFESGWREPWMERSMARRSNTFRLEIENNNRYLRIDSHNSASALWRRVDLDGLREPVVSWRWRVSNSLGHIKDERRRGSDDYAARVAVMFDGEPFGRNTPFLMYVWAGNEAVGNIYPSPYTGPSLDAIHRQANGGARGLRQRLRGRVRG